MEANKLKNISGRDLFDRCFRLVKTEKMTPKQMQNICDKWLEVNDKNPATEEEIKQIFGIKD
jgi:hypothetical protein